MPRAAMDAALDGERWQLADQFRSRLVTYAYARLGNMHDAEDCASEAILRAVSFAELDEARISQFLFTLTQRLCVDVLRARARETRALQRAFGPAPGEPDEDICDRDEAQWVLSLVSSLPPGEGFAMRALAAGARPKEAAQTLGVTAKAFESAVGRARKRLKVAWQATLGLAAVAATRIASKTHQYTNAAATTATALAISGVVVGAAPASQAQTPTDLAMSEQTSTTVAVLSDRPRPHQGSAVVVPRGGRAPVARPPTRTNHGSSDRTLASAPPVHAGKVVSSGGGPLVSQHDDGDGPVESVLDCVTKGVDISPQSIGCRD